MTRLAIAASVLLALSGCASPAPMSGPTTTTTNPQIAARCRLLAYHEDHGWLATGLPSMLIVTAMASNRRQEIFNACLEAGE
jgi:hypothetical protein